LIVAKNAFENKFAHDADLQFKITARRNKLIGQWAAEKMGLTPEENHILCDLGRAKPISKKQAMKMSFAKLLGDLTSAGVEVDDAMIRAALDAKMVEARRQFIEQA
jgi:hypothetical protein